VPTYQYECARCERILEVFQSINDPPKKRCPHCGGSLKRLIGGGAGVILKGSGFHNTDYRPRRPPEGAKEGSANSEKSEGTPAPKPAETKEKKEGGSAKKPEKG
jgi:putative FmdB family regulatory protein